MLLGLDRSSFHCDSSGKAIKRREPPHTHKKKKWTFFVDLCRRGRWNRNKKKRKEGWMSGWVGGWNKRLIDQILAQDEEMVFWERKGTERGGTQPTTIP